MLVQDPSPMWFGGVANLCKWWVCSGRDVALLFLFHEGDNEGGILNCGSEELKNCGMNWGTSGWS